MSSRFRIALAMILVGCLAVGTVVIAAQDDYGRAIIVEKREAVKVFETSGGDAVYAAACILRSVTLRNTQASGYVYIYDNATAGSGTKVMILGAATDEDGIASTGHNISCANGIYATIGNLADVTITYQIF